MTRSSLSKVHRSSAWKSPVRAVSVAAMQQIDTAAIEAYHIPRLLLMEHAGLAVARRARWLLRRVHAPIIVVCCGSGYNGGDGLATARHLHEWGYGVRVLLTGALERLREEPAIYAAILQQLGVPLKVIVPGKTDVIRRWIRDGDLVIDALLGIGVHGEVREPLTALIQIMNASGKRMLAVDVPSGLDADTGMVQGCAVRASVTLTFGLPKQGCVKAMGRAYTGRLITDAITIPRTLLQEGA